MQLSNITQNATPSQEAGGESPAIRNQSKQPPQKKQSTLNITPFGKVQSSKKAPSRIQRMALNLKLSDQLNAKQVGRERVNSLVSKQQQQASTTGQNVIKFESEYSVDESEHSTQLGEGRFATVKRCTRQSDKQGYAVKEVRSDIEDVLQQSVVESNILKRLQKQENPNIVQQIGFYENKPKQTSQLVLEALEGATLDKFVEIAGIGIQSEIDYSSHEESKDNSLNKSFTPQKGQAQMQKENIGHLRALGSSQEEVQRRPRVLSDQVSQYSKLSQFKLNSHRRSKLRFRFEEKVAKPLMRQVLTAVRYMHSVGVCHRDLNPSNVFIHFPKGSLHNIDVITEEQDKDSNSPMLISQQENQLKQPVSAAQKTHLWRSNIGQCTIKIIDFNSARMFNIDESPVKQMDVASTNVQNSDCRSLNKAVDNVCTISKPGEVAQTQPSEVITLKRVTISEEPKQTSQPVPVSESIQVQPTQPTEGQIQQDSSSSHQWGHTHLTGQKVKKSGQMFQMFSPRVGTPMYRAPDIITRKKLYTESVDLWGVGCVLYFLLTSKAPFSKKQELEMINEQIKNGLYNQSRPEYYKLSEQAKDLIQGLLEVEVDKRLTVDQALNHQWFQ